VIYLKTSLEEIEKNKVLLKVEVPTERIDKDIEKACKEISKKIKIPGFRPGKIPSKVVRSHVGMAAIYNEILQNTLPGYYSEAIDKEGVSPIAQPEVDIVQIEEGKPFKFNAKVEVKPEVKLGKYKGLKVTKEKLEIQDEWVDRQIENLRGRSAQLEPVERKIKKGDFALINFEGTVEGKTFEGGSAEDYLLEIGSGRFVGSFEEQLEGAGKAEIRDIWIDFPANYQNQELAGKKAKFRVLVKEVKQKVLPEPNDDFAKEISEFDTLEELKKDIREKLKKTGEQQIDFKLRMDVLNKAVEGVEVDIPETMIKNRKELKLKDFVESLKKQGIGLEEYLKATNQDNEKLEKEAEKETKEELKKELTLDAIARAEKLEITDEETDNEITSIAKSGKQDPKEAIERVKQQGSYEFIREDLRIRKAWNLLAEEAEVSEVAPKPQSDKVKKEEKSEEKETKTEEKETKKDK